MRSLSLYAALVLFIFPNKPANSPSPQAGPVYAQPANSQLIPGQFPANSVNAKAEAPKHQSIPADAVAMAFLDAHGVPFADRFFTRWVWFRTGLPEDAKAVIAVLNHISRNPDIFNPPAGGILVRVDLRNLVSTDKELEQVIELWEQFAFDPFFSLLITGDTLRLLSPEQKRSTLVTRRWREWPKNPDGSWGAPVLRTDTVPVAELKDIVVERAMPAHLAHSGIEKLQAATHSLAPIVSDTYFVGRVESTIKDRTKVGDKERENLFSVLYGGLYYEFSGIRKGKNGVTDLDQFVTDFVLGGVQLKFQQFFDRLPASQRAALLRSEITGKPRRVVWAPTLNARQTEARGIAFITFDVEDADVDSSGHAVLNLEDGLRPKAFEAIVVKPNGHLVFALFDAAGKLLDEADANKVVSDRTVPHPYTAKLQSGISCLRCHGPHKLWIPFENDVLALSREIDIFGEFNKVNTPEKIKRLQGFYRGDVPPLLDELRRQQARTFLLSTGPWKSPPALANQSDVVEQATSRIAATYARDRYLMVDPATALAELGEVVPRDKEGTVDEKVATYRVKRLLSPPPAAPGVFVFDDPRLAALRVGKSVLRNDFNLTYAFMAARAAENRRRILQAEPGRN